jgi:tRNA A-37 threonylcarbamoyl transferase component Bud32
MSSAATEVFLATLRQHHLLEPAQLDELARGARRDDPRALAAELIRRDWLTPYQANQVLAGRAANLLLGSYVLLARLGAGGMGQVFKARNWKLGRVVALKLIRKERLANEAAVRRFQREIRAAAQLTHPNIVHAYDADEVNGTHFFVMEYVMGRDLAQVLKAQGPLPLAAACDYVRQAALGLQHAHERGLVHRDIKPHNLLLTERGEVKILDMGLAQLDASAADEGASSTLTEEGLVMGTLDYIAPEQVADAHTVDSRADLYSLGCTFYHLLTGSVPFPACPPVEKLYKHRYEEPAPVERRRAEVPPAMAAVVRKLMAKLPSDRYQTPAELAAVLTPWSSAVGGVSAPHDPSRALPADTAPTGSGNPVGETAPTGFTGLGPGQTGAGPGALVRGRQRRERQRLLLLTGAGVALVLVGLVTLSYRLVMAGPRAAGTQGAREAQAGMPERTPRSSPRNPNAVPHEAVGARVTIVPDKPGYLGTSVRGLADGLLAEGEEVSSPGWMGWERPGTVEVTLDLAQPTKVTKLAAHFLRAVRVELPVQVELSVSEDGKVFRTVATVLQPEGRRQRGWYTAAVDAVTASRVRVRATPGGDWIYLDEVAVNPPPEVPQLRHAARGRPVTLAFTPGESYFALGVQGLTDGFVASSPDFWNLNWLGIESKNLDATIDLGSVLDVREVGGHFLQNVKLGIYMPVAMDVLVSGDGKEFRPVGTVKHAPDERGIFMKTLSAKLTGVTGRFVKVVAHTNGMWLFADEVFVNPEPGEGE